MKTKLLFAAATRPPILRSLILVIVVLFNGGQRVEGAIEVTQTEFEGRPQFCVRTKTATYWYDIAGGGFSRLIDRQGKDWISFNKSPLSKFPDSAAAGYRGLPNLVYGGDKDSGAGHPGFDQCESFLVEPDCIRTTTKSGRWSWQWTFTDRHATCDILKVDESRAYWFLYEGPIGGHWSPETHYFGTDLEGPLFRQPDGGHQLFGQWQWVYFGDRNADQTLLLAQLQPDQLDDTIWYLGNSQKGLQSQDGMVVFGFGRAAGTRPLLTKPGLQFRIGFVSANDSHSKLSSIAARWTADAASPTNPNSDGSKPNSHQSSEQQTDTAEETHDEPDRWRGPSPKSGETWPTTGHWFERSWFQMGEEFANPAVNNRFRVNGPYVATHPEFHRRQEPRGNGQMLVPLHLLPREIRAARLYLELWGGHPGSTHRRVSVNGRSTYGISVPHPTHCTHAYRSLPLMLTDLVYGNNSLQFNVDGDETFWGHFIVEEAAIDALLSADSPRLKGHQPLVNDPAKVRVQPAATGDGFRVSLELPDQADASQIERVDFQAWYDGFDENGDGITRDWHGMTKRKQPLGHLGSAHKPPFEVDWDTSHLEAQPGVRVRALVHLKNSGDIAASERQLQAECRRYWKQRALIYQTDASQEFEITHPAGITVVRLNPTQMSVPFWSRADKVRTCTFDVPEISGKLMSATLQCVAWDGGAGDVLDYFQLAGQSLEIAADGQHDVVLSRRDIDVNSLKSGKQTASLRSDTHHHGIEILYPGPSLFLRYATKDQ